MEYDLTQLSLFEFPCNTIPEKITGSANVTWRYEFLSSSEIHQDCGLSTFADDALFCTNEEKLYFVNLS